MAQTPASIRYNNPGAQYPGPSARKFGSVGTEIIGGGHKIAVFDDPVKGAAAQFDLLKRGYTGLTLGEAIRKWSGGNSSPAYANAVANATGVPLDTVLTKSMIDNPAFAVPFAKASASWEAGRDYPMSDEQWIAAHSMASGGAQPQTAAVDPIHQTDFGRTAPSTPAAVAAASPSSGQTAPAQTGAAASTQGSGLLAGLIGDNQISQALAGLEFNTDDGRSAMPRFPSVDLPTARISNTGNVNVKKLLDIVNRRSLGVKA